MTLALRLAASGLGHVEPNPMVGCVLVRDGRVVGEGYHQRFGGPHAEVNALADCRSRGLSAQAATAYVTLEPCCHYGKTPPCADALIRAKIARVVVSVVDPFKQVSGGGIQKLRDAGIEVTTGVLESQGRQLLSPYLKRVETGRPWVIAKWAMSIDGKIASATGQSQWITGESARREVHLLRGRVDAIAVGMGTVVADDPLLTPRHGGPRTPARIVFALSRTPDLESQLVRTAGDVPTWIVAGPGIADSKLALLSDHHLETIRCDSADPVAMIDEVLQILGGDRNPFGQPMTHVMLEGGSELLGSFAAARQIDECHVYIGAKLIGGRHAPGPVGQPGFDNIHDFGPLDLVALDRFDQDVRLTYRRSINSGKNQSWQ